MVASGQVLHQPVQTEGGPVRLYHPAKPGAAPYELGELVLCKCSGDRWNVELCGDRFTDKDGYPSQRAKYTCSKCSGSVHDHAALPKG